MNVFIKVLWFNNFSLGGSSAKEGREGEMREKEREKKITPGLSVHESFLSVWNYRRSKGEKKSVKKIV